MSRTFPMPPANLSARIGGAEADYDAIGTGHAKMLRDILPTEWTWQGKKVLDFGCGTGRTLVQFAEEADEAEFWGCDIDEPSIEWAAANLSPPFHFVANGALPPIDVPSSTFDLISGFSVFTHLLETWPDWLLEIHRLLKPGGYAVFTFLGEGMIRDLVGREWNENRIGMIELDAGRPWSVGGPNALHSEWWLRAHWGRLFEVTDVVPYAHADARYGHGLISLRKDHRPAPSVAELLHLESNDPREAASLQFNVELLKERSAYFWEHDSGSLRIENEHLHSELQMIKASKSWRLTGQLRRLRSLAARRV